MDRVTSGRMAPDMTIFEAVVLAEAETKYFDLRKDIVSKRDEMLRKLKRLGISTEELYFDDKRIPKDVLEWMSEYERHLRARKRIENLWKMVTGQPQAGTGTSRPSNGKSSGAKPAGPVKGRTMNFGLTSDSVDFHTPVVEVMVYVESEKRYFELRKQIVSQMADMIGKLKKLGYDMENLDMDDQRMPPDVRAWLRKYQRHTEMREKLAEMKAKLYGEPKPGASEKLGAELAAAASRKETLRSRTDRSSRSSMTTPAPV